MDLKELVRPEFTLKTLRSMLLGTDFTERSHKEKLIRGAPAGPFQKFAARPTTAGPVPLGRHQAVAEGMQFADTALIPWSAKLSHKSRFAIRKFFVPSHSFVVVVDRLRIKPRKWPKDEFVPFGVD